jgi:hypothetical protein
METEVATPAELPGACALRLEGLIAAQKYVLAGVGG